MKKYIMMIGVSAALLVAYFSFFAPSHTPTKKPSIFFGAFLGDAPTRADIEAYRRDFGKAPYCTLIFIDWEKFVSKEQIESIVSSGSLPLITWEPWIANGERGIDLDKIIDGTFDSYIDGFAKKIGEIETTVYLRFAHEMNGNWYPWSSARIGSLQYKSMYRHIKDRFDALHISNVRWIFSINYENVPTYNDYTLSYPGDQYVDYIGIDGYNWGYTRPSSTWKSFSQIFSSVYQNICSQYTKDILITEMSSASEGGDRPRWFFDAFQEMKRMERLKGFVLFDMDKEADWNILPESASGIVLKKALQDPCFVGASNVDKT